MTTLPTDATTARWVYVKLYLGRAIDRMDRLLIALASEPVLTERAESWFYLRYVDERGIHVRLRALTREGDDRNGLRRALIDAGAARLAELQGQPQGNHHPMVHLPGFEDSLARVTAAPIDVYVTEDRYAPETDKYGARPGLDAAERLFHQSSRLAAQVLALEERGLLSRKDLLPVLMQDATQAFLPCADHARFWARFGYHCLHGRLPVAEDGRQTFANKGHGLAKRSIRFVAPDSHLGDEARAIVTAWRGAVRQAAADYAALGRQADTSPEVLAFNVVHLMNNRLGLAAQEEAYIAALLERQAQGQGVGSLE
jgi:thiopeptide-type bacteriocin biosynthesis protein